VVIEFPPESNVRMAKGAALRAGRRRRRPDAQVPSDWAETVSATDAISRYLQTVAASHRMPENGALA